MLWPPPVPALTVTLEAAVEEALEVSLPKESAGFDELHAMNKDDDRAVESNAGVMIALKGRAVPSLRREPLLRDDRLKETGAWILCDGRMFVGAGAGAGTGAGKDVPFDLQHRATSGNPLTSVRGEQRCRDLLAMAKPAPHDCSRSSAHGIQHPGITAPLLPRHWSERQEWLAHDSPCKHAAPQTRTP